MVGFQISILSPFLGRMSVNKFWVAGDEPIELTARETPNALEPFGDVIRDDGSVLATDNIEEGISQAVRSVALCNAATYVHSVCIWTYYLFFNTGFTKIYKRNGNLREIQLKSLFKFLL